MDSDRIDRITLLNNSYLLNFLRFSPIKLTNELHGQIIESYIDSKVYDDLIKVYGGFPCGYSIALYPKRLRNNFDVLSRVIIDDDLYEKIQTQALNINKSIAEHSVITMLRDYYQFSDDNVNVIFPNNYLKLGCYIDNAYFNPGSRQFKCDINDTKKLDILPYAHNIIIELDIEHKELNRLKLNSRFFHDCIYRGSYVNTPLPEILSPCNEIYLNQE